MSLPIALRRLAYRSAYVALRGYWFVRRPQVEGVKCVLTRGEDVLLVRHTYGKPRWDLPGGTLKRGEDPEHAARREMREELGVEIDDWRSLGAVCSNADYRRDRMHCFRAELDDAPLTVDLGEIASVHWFGRGALPPNLNDHVRQILARVNGAR